MLSEHFGLRGEPFSLSPDPACLYAGPEHAEALAGLSVALESGRGLATLIGEVGTGKTTLLNALLARLGPNTRIACISNTRLSFSDLMGEALQQFGVECASRRLADLLYALKKFLEGSAESGDSVALVIDEAQNLSADAFEDLRLLTNVETPTAKLLQIVLVGQPELAEILGRPEQRHIAERVAFHCRIGALCWRERRAYLRHRLACAGGTAAIFTPAARWLLLATSRGVPRRINVVGHTAMLFAFGRGRSRVGLGPLRAALRERRRSLAPPIARQRPMRRAAAWSFAIALAALALPWMRSPWSAPVALGRSEVPPPSIAAAEHPVSAAAHPPRDRSIAALAESSAVEECALGLKSVGDAEAAIAGIAPSAPVPRRPASTRRPAYSLVKVRPGTTLAAVARRFYGAPSAEAVGRIRAANPELDDPHRLTVGQVIRVPEPAVR